MHTTTHTYAHTKTHTHIHTHAHSHTHTHMLEAGRPHHQLAYTNDVRNIDQFATMTGV